MNQIYKNEAAWELIAKSLSGNADDKEKERLQLWLDESPSNLNLFEECKLTWEKSGSVSILDTDNDKAWAKLKSKIAPTKSVKVYMFRQYLKYTAVAAMLAFAILTYFTYPEISGYFNIENRDDWYAVTNDSDEPKSVQMPDGSTIVLNKKAKLRYPEKFDKRAVELSGEAYFQITFNPQKSFTVFTAESEIEVIGTSFNVRNPENSKDVFVMVESGKVSFKNPRNQPLLLLAGKGAYFNAQKSEIELNNNPNSSSWKTKTFRFQNTTVKEVLASLQSVYGLNVQVSNDELLKCEFNGTFDKFQAENILHALSFSLGAELSFSNNIYLLTGEGCNQ